MKIKLTLIVFFFSLTGFTQQFNIRNFGAKEGLSSSNVNSVCQDSEGYIWFATQNGICRFDGGEINEVIIDSTISSIDATFIMEDSKFRIWIGTTSNGAFYIENGKVSNITTKDGLPNNWVNSVFEDSKGQIWFATDVGVAFLEGKHINVLMDKDSLLTDVVYCVSETQNNEMWFGTVKNGLISKKENTFSQHSSEGFPVSNSIYSLCPINSNELIIGTTESGAYIFNRTTFTQVDIPELKEAWISKSILKEENIFFITSNGLFKYNISSRAYEKITQENGLVSNDLFSGILDVNNNIWVTSGDKGVSVIRNEKIESFNKKYGLSSNNIVSIDILSDSILIIGTHNKGINLLNVNNIINYNDHQLSNGISVISIIEEEVWVGGNSYSEGISVYELKNDKLIFKKLIDTINGVDINIVMEILKDKNNITWIATYGAGLFKIDKSDTIRFSKNNILVENDLLSMHIDRLNRVWLGIYSHGIFLMENDSIKNINELFNLKELNVECINQDLNGNILLGNKTEGITIISEDLKEVKQLKNELLSNHISNIEVDPHNDIWIGTDLGINRIKINKNLEIVVLNTITEQNGLISSEVVKNGLKYSNGIIWTATPLGVSKLLISDLDKPIVKNKIALKEVKLFFKQVDWTKYKEVELDRYNIPKTLNLPYFKNHITFEFNTMSINEQTYSYMLEGWDNEWTPYSSLNNATYSNLQSGEYLFKVKSIDSFQSESANVFEIPLTIYPPFWKTWWFIIILLLLIVIILYGLFMHRTATLRKRQLELEKTIRLRTSEVVEQKKEAETQRDLAQKEHQIAEEQKELVEEKNKEISDSINYAERIQRAMLANEEIVQKYLTNYFIFFQPKDVVSGDFYWASVLNNGKLALVNADSTGHGVPGAIMSMLNMNSLKEAVAGKGLTEPHKILNHASKIVKETLQNDGSEEGGKDGMDCSLMVFDLENNKIQFSAANNPVWIVRENEIIEFKGDKMPIGKHDRDTESFTTKTFEVLKNDMIYTLTDGMPDQFGGPKGKKFMYKRLKNLLIEISYQPMKTQHNLLKAEMLSWMGDEEQVDDICIIGIRV